MNWIFRKLTFWMEKDRRKMRTEQLVAYINGYTKSFTPQQKGEVWKESVVRQVQRLLSEDNWSYDSYEISSGSLFSFLLYIRECVRFYPELNLPSLGVSQRENITAVWMGKDERLHAEFYPAKVILCTTTRPGVTIHFNAFGDSFSTDLKTWIENNDR